MTDTKSVLQAHDRLLGRHVKTRLLEYEQINELLGGRVLFKAENPQPSGSFSFQGVQQNRLTRFPVAGTWRRNLFLRQSRTGCRRRGEGIRQMRRVWSASSRLRQCVGADPDITCRHGAPGHAPANSAVETRMSFFYTEENMIVAILDEYDRDHQPFTRMPVAVDCHLQCMPRIDDRQSRIFNEQ